MRIIQKEYILQNKEYIQTMQMSSGSGFVSINLDKIKIYGNDIMIIDINNEKYIERRKYKIKYKLILFDGIKRKYNFIKYRINLLLYGE